MAKKASKRAVTFQAKTALNRANEEALKDKYHIGKPPYFLPNIIISAIKFFYKSFSTACTSCLQHNLSQETQGTLGGSLYIFK